MFTIPELLEQKSGFLNMQLFWQRAAAKKYKILNAEKIAAAENINDYQAEELQLADKLTTED